ncbi:helix-turn-helix transcriptional regulator [Pusillimonas minor]|uniref:DNA-binding protein n=1 Tax=Pusillimonas minor TaxID=2697024 RepID=A0A842HLN5_9BURK|nr:helix-turn-helix domain-containing protein [Pusillimonas minor]MBC2768438.1 DNA-binding protein [Pusillimonas minor]
MEVVHLNQKQLAARWSISEATLERWRSEGLGPKFLKLCGRVLYRQMDIEAYEESCLATRVRQLKA